MIEKGEVFTLTLVQVDRCCFYWDLNCCWRSTNIEVRNCGSFYTYHFSSTAACT